MELELARVTVAPSFVANVSFIAHSVSTCARRRQPGSCSAPTSVAIDES